MVIICCNLLLTTAVWFLCLWSGVDCVTTVFTVAVIEPEHSKPQWASVILQHLTLFEIKVLSEKTLNVVSAPQITLYFIGCGDEQHSFLCGYFRNTGRWAQYIIGPQRLTWLTMYSIAASHHYANRQLIWVLIAPDCLLSPVSLAKICSIFIFSNYRFVWQHLSGLALEKPQLLMYITNSALRHVTGSTHMLKVVSLWPRPSNTTYWFG